MKQTVAALQDLVAQRNTEQGLNAYSKNVNVLPP